MRAGKAAAAYSVRMRRTMRWGGVVIALFIDYHLLHLTSNTIHPGGAAAANPYARVVNGFGLWWGGAELHDRPARAGLPHPARLWSAMADLGANTSVTRHRHLNIAATTIAIGITAEFLMPPVGILFGWVGG